MSKPIRVAFGITELNVGGAEKSLVELVTRLDRGRFEPSVVSLMPLGPLADVLRDRGIRVESLELTSGWQFATGLSRWRTLLRRDQPGLLVTFLFHANILGRWSARRAGIKHVSSVRVAERQRRWHGWIDRATRGMTAGYVCVSRSTADLVRATTGAPPPMVEVIGNGVDVSLADAAQPVDDDRWPVPAGELALLFLGRLADQKDPESAIRSLADHRRRHPASLMHLVMVGDGPMRGACERITQQERVLAGHVHVVGAQVDPYAWLLRADGLINTSRWEGMPNAILEAMAARRCVIATPVDGNAEVVVDGETGWLRSGAGIVDAMREFEADAFKRAALGDAGRRRVQEHFSIQRTVRAWEELIAGCLGS